MTGFVYAIGDSERVTPLQKRIAASRKAWRVRKRASRETSTSGASNGQRPVGERRAESQPHPRHDGH